MNDLGPIKLWPLIKREDGPALPLFRVEFEFRANPRNEEVLKALVLKAPDTVNVIAVSEHMEWLLVEQYRFGIAQALVELPAGLIDGQESALGAAQRELREETGYVADNWTYLGKSFINPAYVSNSCYHFLALGARQVGELVPDHSEDLRVSKRWIENLEEIPSLGLIRDAIGLAALSYLALQLHKV